MKIKREPVIISGTPLREATRIGNQSHKLVLPTPQERCKLAVGWRRHASRDTAGRVWRAGETKKGKL